MSPEGATSVALMLRLHTHTQHCQVQHLCRNPECVNNQLILAPSHTPNHNTGVEEKHKKLLSAHAGRHFRDDGGDAALLWSCEDAVAASCCLFPAEAQMLVSVRSGCTERSPLLQLGIATEHPPPPSPRSFQSQVFPGRSDNCV